MEGLIFGILRYFYRSLGCPQLTSSSCDVRVHFTVARQRYFSANANAVPCRLFSTRSRSRGSGLWIAQNSAFIDFKAFCLLLS